MGENVRTSCKAHNDPADLGPSSAVGKTEKTDTARFASLADFSQFAFSLERAWSQANKDPSNGNLKRRLAVSDSDK